MVWNEPLSASTTCAWPWYRSMKARLTLQMLTACQRRLRTRTLLLRIASMDPFSFEGRRPRQMERGVVTLGKLVSKAVNKCQSAWRYKGVTFIQKEVDSTRKWAIVVV